MATKRKEKLEKRAIRKHKRLKSTNALLGIDLTKFMENPYTSDEDEQADIDLMKIAWKAHYGELPEGFVAPLFEKQDEEQNEESKMLPWVATYKDLLFEKYADKTIVEHRSRFSLFTLLLGFGDAIPPED